jgi:capsule polysaccharide export protein KpsE/RkpR
MVTYMADSREVLEMMRQVAKIRIGMLREGTTFHSKSKQAYYLKEYEDKLREIEGLIRRMNIRLVYSKGSYKSGGDGGCEQP